MCLAIPMKIISKERIYGKVELDGVRREGNLSLVPDAIIGDYVIIHAGCTIEIIDTVEASKTIALFKEFIDSEDNCSQ